MDLSQGTPERQDTPQSCNNADIAPLQEPPANIDVPQEAGLPRPRRNQAPAQRPAREGPDLYTHLIEVLQNIRRNLVQVEEAAPAQAPDFPEDPNFNWDLLRTPPETRFPVPGTGTVQRIAADLLARLPTMKARDQHDARFVLAMTADWQTLGNKVRDVVFQRLNLYAIVASFGWPTAIQASSLAAPSLLLLPSGMQPIQRQQNHRGWRNNGRQQKQEPVPEPASRWRRLN